LLVLVSAISVVPLLVCRDKQASPGSGEGHAYQRFAEKPCPWNFHVSESAAQLVFEQAKIDRRSPMLRFSQKKYIVPSLLLLFLTVAGPLAFAHSRPVSMDPAANATVASPQKVIMHFTGDLEPRFSSITVRSATGHVVNKGASAVSSGDAKLMTVALPPLPAGIYTVDWVAVAMDSHRMQSSYKFTVK
jgi:hypothetical protein